LQRLPAFLSRLFTPLRTIGVGSGLKAGSCLRVGTLSTLSLQVATSITTSYGKVLQDGQRPDHSQLPLTDRVSTLMRTTFLERHITGHNIHHWLAKHSAGNPSLGQAPGPGQGQHCVASHSGCDKG